MATSTADYIASGETYSPFYYLKITGIPYYFFSTIDPTSSRYGAAAWSLPSGYTAVSGMMLPDDTLDQSMPDVLGGIASAERLRLEMVDFDVTDTNGAHSFFGRLMAPGRITSSGSAAVGTLASDITVTDTTADTFLVEGTGDNAFGTGSTYIGGETINVTAAAFSAPNWTLTIGTRNKFPCASGYPPIPYHRTTKLVGGQIDPSASVLVTQEPLSIIGRTCAFYIGHRRADDAPEPEAQALLRMVGRITGITYGRQAGLYEFQIESVTSDLAKSKVAPGLAHGELADGIYLQDENWRRFTITAQIINDLGEVILSDAANVTVDNGSTNFYTTAKELVDAINAQLVLAANQMTYLTTGTLSFECHISESNHILFTCVIADLGTVTCRFALQFRGMIQPGVRLPDKDGGLLSALGWSPGDNTVFEGGGATDGRQRFTILSPKLAPRVFVPTANLTAPIQLTLADTFDSAGDRFTDNTVNGAGLVRFGDGHMMQVTAHTAGTVTVTEAATNVGQPYGAPRGSGRASYDYCYYVEAGQDATVDQVIGVPTAQGDGPDSIWGRLICSNGQVADSEYNYFPEGIGLGLDGIFDKDSLRALSVVVPSTSGWYVDSALTFGELWTPVAKECGLFVVWDVSLGKFSIKRSTNPSLANADSFVFSDSNRVATDDRTTAGIETAQLRTGWLFRYGWDSIEKKFLNEQSITDYWAVSAYQNTTRQETIEDKTITSNNKTLATAVLQKLIAERSPFVRYPWLKIKRTVNTTGLTLSPGTFHQIIDNTIVNPFTGVMGITSADGVYGWLMGVSMKLDDGSVTATLLLDQITDASLVRQWSPTALLDFDATQNGYVTTTGIVTLASWYTSTSTNYDGIDFEVGDTIALVPWDTYIGSPSYEKTSTVTAVATDGRTVTVATGLGAVSTTVETIMILRPYASATTARKSGASRVAFQGDGVSLLIDNTVRLHRWG